MPADPPEDVTDLVRIASDFDARRDVRAAAEAWSRAHVRAPTRPEIRLGYAQSLIRAARPGDALPLLEALIAMPGAPAAAWLAYGVALALLDRYREALRASEQATAMAPGICEVHLGHGDVLYRSGDWAGARRAYERAHAIAPDHPDVLGKLAHIAHIRKEHPKARVLLERALAQSPSHPTTRYNFAVLAVLDGRVEEARREVEALLEMPGLDREMRTTALETLALLDERDRLAAPVADALARDDVDPLAEALRREPGSPLTDSALADAMREMVDRAANKAPIDHAFAPCSDRSGRWHAIESHLAFRTSRGAPALERDLRLVAGEIAPAESVDDDVVRHACAVKSRPARRPPADALALDAWLRLAHARLLAHRVECWPGFYKPTHSTQLAGSAHARVSPPYVSGTVRTILPEITRRLPPGGWRATLVLAAIVLIHPFVDGNKRLARFLANGELEAAGLMPHMHSPGKVRTLVQLAIEVKERRDAEPLATWLAAASRESARFDAEWAAGTLR